METVLPIINDNPKPAQRRRLFPAVLLSALLMTLAFPPVDAGFLAWVGLAPLFYALPLARRTRHAFALGYLFGFVHWGWTICWIGTTVTNWAHTPLGWLAWSGLVAVKSGWFGLFGGLAWWIGRRAQGAARPLSLAAAWTLVEWFRGQGGLAMPWSLIGYTQYRYLPIIQISDLTGFYGVTFALAWVNAALADGVRCTVFGVRWAGALESRAATQGRPYVTPSSHHPFIPSLPPLLLVLLLLAYGAFRLSQSYEGPTVRLALMQPNNRSERSARRPTREERDAATQRDLAQFAAMTARIAGQRPFLILWPETITDDAVNDLTTRKAFFEMARASGAYHLVGTGYADAQERPSNSAALFTPDDRLAARYDKTWLVPYGEWIPGRSWMPFGDVFQFIEKDVQAGKREDVVAAGPVRMSVLICFESIFPIVSRTRVARGANLLVSITNDSWAGESAELIQHFAMSTFRTVETRRCLAAAATTGITALIGPEGRVIAAAPPYQERMLTGEARLLDGQTLYVRWGDWFVLLCALIVGFSTVRFRIGNPTSKIEN